MPLPNRYPLPPRLPTPAELPEEPAGAANAGELRYQIRQPDGSHLALAHGPDAEWFSMPGQAQRQEMRAALPRPGNTPERAAAIRQRRLGHGFQAAGVALGGVGAGLLYQSNQVDPAREPYDAPVSRKQVLQIGVALVAAGLAAKSVTIGDNLVADANRVLDAQPTLDPTPPAR